MGSGSISPGRYQPAKRAPLDDRYIRQLVLSQRKHLFISGAHAAAATAEWTGSVCTEALAHGVQPGVARCLQGADFGGVVAPRYWYPRGCVLRSGGTASLHGVQPQLSHHHGCARTSTMLGCGFQRLDCHSSASVHWPQALWNTSTAADQQALDLGPLPCPSSWHIAQSVSGDRIEACAPPCRIFV